MTRNNASTDADEAPAYGFDFTGRFDPEDPETHWVTVREGDLPCQIQVRLGRPKRGRLVCTGLRVGAGDREEEYEVTARMLRDIRLGNVLRALREGMTGVWDDFLSVRTPPLDPALRALIAERAGEDVARQVEESAGLTGGDILAAKVKPLPAVRRGRKGLDAEVLRRTAEVYLEVVESGSPHPQEDTARRLYVSISTVSRRLRTAWQRFPEMKPKGGGR